MLERNVCAIYSTECDKILMCLRRKKLYEETAITREDVELMHFMDFAYYPHDKVIEAYFGILKHDAEVHGEENDLYWIPLSEDFFDYNAFAGDGNIGHLIRIINDYCAKKK